MSEVQCYWVEPTGECRWSLRRFAWTAGSGREGNDPTDLCPDGGHDASAALEGRRRARRTAKGYIAAVPADAVPRDDPRWPRECATCGRPFADTDEWQVNVLEDWRRADTGELASEGGVRALPAGAMLDAWWWPHRYRHPDGISLAVMLPDGLLWLVDGPASDAPPESHWDRTGDPRAVPPTVSATPSILTPAYHGFLTGGVLRST